MMPLRDARVHLLVLHWGDPAVTLTCLASLRACAPADTEVVVIDNGTPDHSGETLASEYPEFTHLRNETNLGFAGGNNVGLRRALERGAQCALLLNNDAEIRPGAVEALVRAADADPRVGLINPKILYAEPEGMIWYAGGSHSLWRGHSSHIGRGEIDRGQHDTACDVSFVTGCALLVRRALLEEIGLLDESLFMYAEDLDLGLRARRAGWRLRYEPGATVIHHERVRR
ncbi:glycosyltransferase family 2 protein, partial [Candidatus Sumerlaeota bacterium]|nr:glycosyltransferase family 2 protein [Candidatus Sumerlaeota bacterium]